MARAKTGAEIIDIGWAYGFLSVHKLSLDSRCLEVMLYLKVITFQVLYF